MNEDRLVGYGGWPVAYRIVRPDGPLRGKILLVHGYSQHSGRFARAMATFARAGFAVLAPDLRGHGRTARVHGDLEHRERVLADLVGAHLVLDTLGDAPTFGFGHSLGAVFVLRHAERHPELFQGLVLSSPALRVPESIPRRVRIAARLLARFTPRLPLQPFFDPVRSTRSVDAQRSLRADPLVYKGRIRAGTGAEVMSLIGEARADLGKITVPVLVTHGSADLRVPVEVSRDALDRTQATDRTLRVYPGLLHDLFEEPEQNDVLADITTWLCERA